eukprot:6528508-Prymnesium_polylepis.1
MLVSTTVIETPAPITLKTPQPAPPCVHLSPFSMMSSEDWVFPRSVLTSVIRQRSRRTDPFFIITPPHSVPVQRIMSLSNILRAPPSTRATPPVASA